jgi:hypothetical protein
MLNAMEGQVSTSQCQHICMQLISIACTVCVATVIEHPPLHLSLFLLRPLSSGHNKKKRRLDLDSETLI